MPKRAQALVLFLVALTTTNLAAAGRELAPRAPAPTTYGTLAPVTAYAQGRFLTIWREDRGNLGSPLVAALSDGNGRRITPQSFTLDLPTMLNPWSMRLIASGDGFTLFWRDNVNGTYLAHLDANGSILGVNRVALPDHTSAEFAWNGTHYLAVLQLSGRYDGVAVLFERDGTVVRRDITIPFAVYDVELTVTNGQFVAVTAGWEGIFVQTITTEGIATHRTIERTGPGRGEPNYRVTFPAVTTLPNGDVLILWNGGDDRRSELQSILFRRDGTLSERKVITVHRASTVPLKVARIGEQLVATFIKADMLYSTVGDLYAVRLDASGAALEEPQQVGGKHDVLARAAASSNALFVVRHVQRIGVESLAIGADAKSREPEILSIHVTRQHQPALGTSGGSAVAVYTELAGTASAVRAAATNANGEPYARSHVALAQLASRDLAWSGTYYLAVYRDATRLMASRINADGRVIDEEPIVLSEYTRPEVSVGAWADDAAVVWAGTNWLVVWNDRERLRFVRVSNGGVPSAPRTLQVHEPIEPPYVGREVTQPALAFDGQRVLLVWTETLYEPCSMMPPCMTSEPQMIATLLTREGDVIEGARTVIPALQAGFFDPRISAASSGREFMIVSLTRAFVVRYDGGRLRLTAESDFAPARLGATDVIWDGAHYVIAHRFRAADWHLAIHRLNADAVPVTTPRGVRTLPPDENAPPSIAAPLQGDALVAVQEGTAEEGVRAVVYREAEMPPLPPAPEPPRNVQVRELTPGRWLVSWDPSPSANVELYIVEGFPVYGGVQQLARVDANTRSVIVYMSNVRVSAVNAGGASLSVGPIRTPTKRRSVR